MEETQALRGLMNTLQDLELINSFRKDCGKHLHDEVPTLNFCGSSGHTGYRLVSQALGEVLTGQIPELLNKAVLHYEVKVKEAREQLKKTQG